MKSDVYIFKIIFTAGCCVGIFPLNSGPIKKVFHFMIIMSIEIVLFILRLDGSLIYTENNLIGTNAINHTLTTIMFQLVCLIGMIYDSKKLQNLLKILEKLDVKFNNIGKKSLQILLPLFLFLTMISFDIAFLFYGDYYVWSILYLFDFLITIQTFILILIICEFSCILCVKYNILKGILIDTFLNVESKVYKSDTKIQEVISCLSFLDKAAWNFNAVTGKKNLVMIIKAFGNILSAVHNFTSLSAYNYQTADVIILYYRLIITSVST